MQSTNVGAVRKFTLFMPCRVRHPTASMARTKRQDNGAGALRRMVSRGDLATPGRGLMRNRLRGVRNAFPGTRSTPVSALQSKFRVGLELFHGSGRTSKCRRKTVQRKLQARHWIRWVDYLNTHGLADLQPCHDVLVDPNIGEAPK